jgi:hypothetical protein
MERWCSDCGVLFVRSLGSSTSSSPPIKFTVPLGRSGFNLLSSGISYQVAHEEYSCAFRFVLFSSYSPQKAKKIVTRSDLQSLLSLLHNLVSESVVLSSCPRLSLVADLDFFSSALFIPSAAIHKKNQSTKTFPSTTDPPTRIRISFHHHKP